METEASQPTPETMRWLEDENQQAKVHLAKLQQQVDHLQTLLWNQSETLRSLEEGLASCQGQVSRLPRVEEELRQIRDLVGRLQEAQSGVMDRLLEQERLRHEEREHERRERAEVSHLLELVERDEQELRQKMQGLEEGQRRLHNLAEDAELCALCFGQDGEEGVVHRVGGRVDLLLGGIRVDHQLADIGGVGGSALEF